MKITGIVAARMASTRFPDKPMTEIHGVPMIGHVFHRARLCESLDDLWVATCDDVIRDYISSIGGKAVMTAPTHERASERIAEALILIEAQTGRTIDVAVLIQGDEPMLEPAMLDELLAPIREGTTHAAVVNLISEIRSDEEFLDPNTVKVVLDKGNHALYFSREAIPSRKKFKGEVPRWKQLGLIAFRRDALLEYIAMPATPLEIIESVDVNRLLEHGKSIYTVPTAFQTAAVDVPSDVETVERLMKGDNLLKRYSTHTRVR